MTEAGKPRTEADRKYAKWYREFHKVRIRKYMKPYLHDYYQRPYVKEKDRRRYHENPKRKAAFLARAKEKQNDPAFRAAKAAYDRRRYQDMKDAKTTHRRTGQIR